jgi:hypothetical protein
LETIRTLSRREDPARRTSRLGRGGVGRCLVLLALAAGLFAAGAAPASASAAGAAPSGHVAKAVAKTVPAPPSGVAVGTVDRAKPRSVSPPQGIKPMTAWSVTLTASSYSLWPTQYTTLTATANSTVTPTIYYIDILDQDTGTLVGHCGTGTVCSVALTAATGGVTEYDAYITDSTDVNGDHAVAFSQSITIDWAGADLTLAAGSHTLPVGNSTTLTETSDNDITYSPFYVQIWDTTTDALLAQCGTGTTCSAVVSQSVATTHTYQATFGGYTTTYPTPELQSTAATNYVTWVGSGLQVALSAPADTVNGPETVTATASINVGPTAYYILIFNENGTLLDSCGSGTTCSFTYMPASYPGSDLVAFISSYSSTLPPANIQAVSNTAVTTYEYIG